MLNKNSEQFQFPDLDKGFFTQKKSLVQSQSEQSSPLKPAPKQLPVNRVLFPKSEEFISFFNVFKGSAKIVEFEKRRKQSNTSSQSYNF